MPQKQSYGYLQAFSHKLTQNSENGEMPPCTQGQSTHAVQS